MAESRARSKDARS